MDKGLSRAFDTARVQDESAAPEASIRNWEALLKKAPDNIHISAALGARYEMLARYDDALPLLEYATEKQPQNALYRLYLLRLQSNIYAEDKTLELNEQAFKRFPDSPQIRKQYTDKLIQAQAYEKAENLLTAESIKVMNTQEILSKIAPAEVMSFVNVLLKKGNADECCDLLKALTALEGPKIRIPAILKLSQALTSGPEIEAVLRSEYETSPDNFKVVQAYFGVLMGMDKIEKASDLKNTFRLSSPVFSPTNLTLYNLLDDQSKNARRQSLFSPIIWRTWQVLNNKTITWEDWTEKLLSHKQKLVLANQYMFLFNDKYDEENYLIDSVSDSILKKYEVSNTGFLMAGTHQGPTSVIGQYFENRFKKYTSITTSQQNLINSYSKSISVQKGVSNLLRATLKNLENGYLVSSASDNSRVADSKDFCFSNDGVKGTLNLSTMIPRLAYKTGCPSIFCGLEWAGNLTRITISEMPSPKRGETRDVYVSRWVEQYIKNLKKTIIGKPENINAWQPIWSDMKMQDQSIARLSIS